MTTPKAAALKLFKALSKMHDALQEIEMGNLPDILYDLHSAFDDKSEKWQESEKGVEFLEGMEALEGFEEMIQCIQSCVSDAVEHLNTVPGFEAFLD